MEGGEEASEVEAVSTAEPSRSLSPGSRLWTARSESGVTLGRELHCCTYQEVLY